MYQMQIYISQIEVKSLLVKQKKEAPNFEDISRRSITCEDCDTKFPKNCEFEQHMVNHNQHEKTFACDECGQSFISLDN